MLYPLLEKNLHAKNLIYVKSKKMNLNISKKYDTR